MSAITAAPVSACTVCTVSAKRSLPGRGLAVPSIATTSAPAATTSSAEPSVGVMNTSKPSCGCLLIPMMGNRDTARTAEMLAAPSTRKPTAPPRSDDAASAAIICGWLSGLSGPAWQDTTMPPASASSRERTLLTTSPLVSVLIGTDAEFCGPGGAGQPLADGVGGGGDVRAQRQGERADDGLHGRPDHRVIGQDLAQPAA